ncbi:protein phosphatase 2C domain-containing protein [Actinomadura sp. WMMB 499]|uniref:protein phosphatase 2C domain-containing protein n=1 Tax=Actinomadura sp. WMMB 499 TaxID=1219491 RepID=UPI001248EB43|nr:protein phosphatase 2C domain-containing protein [Actinomadura sp. WMMB 499]QFG23848.1 protein phosphatase 2C domain-containing protein [Actinomadura sp. WMMB 499]
MQVSYASEATPGRENEDFVAAGPGWVVLLDGATAPPGVDSGCRHDPAWLVRRLGGRIAAGLAVEGGRPLPDLVAEAIKVTGEAHAGTCDLDNPDSPSATVSVLRRRADAVDWLVLADSPILFESAAGAGAPPDVLVCRDDRVDRLPSYTPAAVRAARNSPGGFWVASTKPEAAHEARTGRVPLRGLSRAAVLSDGASRLVERFGLLSWAGLLRALEEEGPAEVLRRTREAEAARPADAGGRGKRHDDATAVLVRF